MIDGYQKQAIAVDPLRADLYVSNGTGINKLDQDTGSVVSSPIQGLSSNAHALAFGPSGDLFVATETSIVWIPGASGTPTTIASGFTIPPGNRTTQYPLGAIFSIAVDGSNDVFFSTVGYWRDPTSNRKGSVPSYIYRLENATWAQSTVSVRDATNSTQTRDPRFFGARVALDYADYSSKWYAFAIAAGGNGTASDNVVYVAKRNDNEDAAALPGADENNVVILPSKYTGQSVLAAGHGVLYAAWEYQIMGYA